MGYSETFTDSEEALNAITQLQVMQGLTGGFNVDFGEGYEGFGTGDYNYDIGEETNAYDNFLNLDSYNALQQSFIDAQQQAPINTGGGGQGGQAAKRLYYPGTSGGFASVGSGIGGGDNTLQELLKRLG